MALLPGPSENKQKKKQKEKKVRDPNSAYKRIRKENL